MLTRSDLLLLAEAAETYPPHCGDSYFSDEDVDVCDQAVRRMIEDPSRSRQFGCPVIVLALVKGVKNHVELSDLTTEVAAAVYTTDCADEARKQYVNALDLNPKKVAKVFRERSEAL